MNRSIKPLRVLLLKPRLLTVFVTAEFVTAETLLLPDFKSNTRQRVLDFQLDRKPTRDDTQTAARHVAVGQHYEAIGGLM